jgi:hypothetical protein
LGEIWYQRLGDISGISYIPPVAVNRSRLPGVNARPTVSRYEFDGVVHISLSWTGGGSASPAERHAASITIMSDVDTAAATTAEALELPGEPTDYHFVIHQGIAQLWDLARDDPAGYSYVEQFAWADIHLLRAAPVAATHIRDGTRSWYQIEALSRLVRLYEREGAWREALAVVELAKREFEQLAGRRDALALKAAALDAEAAPARP